MTRLTKFVGFSSIAALTASAFAAQALRQLVIDGKTVSTNVVQENGHYLVPLDDVAKYFGYTVGVSNDQATLNKIPAPQNSNSSNSGSSNTATNGGGAAQQFSGQVGSQPNDQATNGLNFGNGIGGTGVNNSTSSQFSGQFQNASATQITATVGQTASVNGFDYAVNSIKSVGPKYIDMYDQRGTPLHPKWKTDTLVVVDISETNRGTTAVPAPTSGWFDISVFDGQKIGYRASYLDMMRSSDVVTADNGEEDMYSQADTGSSNLMIGPGGTLHFAAIASVPKDRHISSVMISVSPGGSGSSNGPSAIVTVNQ